MSQYPLCRGGDLILLEEAAFVDAGFFYETSLSPHPRPACVGCIVGIVACFKPNADFFLVCRVAPLLCIGTTSFVAISTLTSDMNFYTKLISKVDPLTNLPVFKSIQIQLACQACIDAEKAHECVHLQHLIPRWQVTFRAR